LKEKCKKLKQLKELTTNAVILHFGNGIVEVSASRESIADSKQSLDALEKLATKAIVSIKTLLTDSFGKVKDTAEFFATYREMSQSFVVDKFAKYGEYSIEHRWVKSPVFKKVKMTTITNLGRRSRVTDKIRKDEMSEAKKEIELQMITNLFFLKAPESVQLMNKRLRDWLNPGRTTMILIEPLNGDTASFDQLINDLEVKDFQSLTWTEKPKEERVKVAREKEEFCVHDPIGYDRHTYLTLDGNSQEWLYVPLKEGSWGEYDIGLVKGLSQYLNREIGKKICGVAPRALHMIAGDANFSPLKNWLADWKPSKKQLAYVKRLSAKNSDTMRLVSQLKDLDDDFLIEMGKEYRSLEKNETETVPEMLVNLIRLTDDYKEFEKRDEKLTKVLDTYPLLADLYYRNSNLDDVTLYVNAKFKAKK
jgi:hypothetical protein